MKNLLPVAKLVSRQKLRKLDILTEDVLNAKSSKFKELYDALQDGKVRNDREAALLLYNSTPLDPRYRQLKSRFRKRLLNTVFFVDQNKPRQTSYEQTYHNCQRDWSLINILRANDNIEYAHYMAKTLLTGCLKYGFAELSVQVARFLADYAAEKGDTKSLSTFEQIIAENSDLLRCEMKGESILRGLKLMLKEKEAKPMVENDLPKLFTFAEELDHLKASCSSSMATYHALEGQTIVHKLLGERERLVQIIDEAIRFSEESPRQMQEQRIRKLRMMQLQAFVELSDLQRGLGAVKDFEPHCKMGSSLWFKLRMAHCSLLLASNQIDRVVEIIKVVKQHRNFAKLGAPSKEAWSIMEALAYVNHDDYSSIDQHAFDVASFIKKEPTFGGDHQRLNAWRHIASIALLYQTKQYSELEPRIAKLRALAVRKLDSKRDRRLITFTQILYRLERKQFRGQVDRVAERYLEELVQLSFQANFEVITFAPVALERILTNFGVSVEPVYV